MEQLCPYCGNKLTGEDQCTNCQREVAWVKTCYLKSESYYMKAYEAAKERKLTTASALLKKSLCFNKRNIEARNLLGLVYYELGETYQALNMWHRSLTLEKTNNIASEYIDKVGHDVKILKTYKASSTLYNEALKYLKEDNGDIAIIRLKKAVSINQKLIEGRLLLALYYIKSNQLKKAHAQIKEVLNRDQNNPKALAYLSEISSEKIESTQRSQSSHTSSHLHMRQISKEPMLDRNSLLLRYTLYFLMGVLCMWITERSLVVPSEIGDYKQQIATLQNEEEALRTSISTLEIMHEQSLQNLQEENEKLKSTNATYEESMSKKEQQEKLTESENLINQGDYEAAAELLYHMIPSYLSEEDYARYEQLKEKVYTYVGSIG